MILLEGGPRITPTFPLGLSANTEGALRRLGVEVRTGALVCAIAPEAVHVGDGIIPSRAIVWAAGLAHRRSGARWTHRSIGVAGCWLGPT